MQWYELVPLLSFLCLRGKCKKCHTKLSIQYPLIEALNGVLYVVIFLINGFNVDSLLYCGLTSALIVLSVIDFRTYEIPIGINIFILIVGLIHLGFHYTEWVTYVIGFFAVSIPIFIIILATHGKGMGGGDMKLMAVAGLLLGWKNILLAFLIGCILGSVIHLIRMKISDADRVLAMGPYLAAGTMIAALWGQDMIAWYLGAMM